MSTGGLDLHFLLASFMNFILRKFMSSISLPTLLNLSSRSSEGLPSSLMTSSSMATMRVTPGYC